MSADRSRARLAAAIWAALALACAPGCRDDDGEGEAGVGGDRSGCGDPGSHSVPIGAHSCICEAGYDWCDEAIDDFDCCPVDDPDTGTTDTGAPAPDASCDEANLEALLCVEDPDQPGPAAARLWACNGESWVQAPGYATFECLAQGFAFAYGCLPDQPTPTFLCGFGPGTSCEVGPGGLCVDSDIIDTCVWGKRTVDRCSRLCTALEAFGPGYADGNCHEPQAGLASCACRK